MKTILITLCLSFFIFYGSAEGKKCQVFLKYKDGKISKAQNNCKSEIGRQEPMIKIVNGKVKKQREKAGKKRGWLRSTKNGKVVEEVSFSFDNVKVMYDTFDGEEMSGHQEAADDFVFVAEIPYVEGSVDTIEIVSVEDDVEIVKDIHPTKDIEDISNTNGQLASDSCDLDMVILCERYPLTSAGLSRFLMEARNIRDYVMSLVPWNEFTDRVNWYWPATVEQMREQGCETDWSDPGRAGICRERSLMSAGCVYCHVKQIRQDYDNFYVLINEPDIYGGAATKACPYPDTLPSESRDKFSWGTNRPGLYWKIAAHELGHSVFGLDDEYQYLDYLGNPLIAEWPNYCKTINCCATCDVETTADYDKNGIVDLFDLKTLMSEYGRTNCFSVPCQTDFNSDGVVNVADLNIMKYDFGKSACYWDRKPGCEGSWQVCTYQNRYRCAQSCIMRSYSGSFCRRCENIMRLFLQQCHNN